MQNILNNSTRSIYCRLLEDEYYDYMLYRGETYGDIDLSKFLIADFQNWYIENGRLYSGIIWNGAYNNGVKLNDIGLVGMDNGFIKFDRDKISNYDFLKLFTGSTFEIASGDTRLFLSPITGNTQEYQYPMNVVETGDSKYMSFRGGFYQGFYKLYDFDYQTLPNKVTDNINYYFELRPRSDYDIEKGTLNEKHPENEGIFFYLGARAENKFWPFYKQDEDALDKLKVLTASNDGYFDTAACDPSIESEYDFYKNNVVNSEYLLDEPETEDIPIPDENDEEYFLDEYSYDDIKPCGCECSGDTDDNPCAKVSKERMWELYTYDYQENSNCCKCKDEEPCGCDCKDCSSYYGDDYLVGETCPDTNKSIEDEYIMPDAVIDPYDITDSEGHKLFEKGFFEINTDNKFVFFNRTKTGFTVDNWDDDMMVSLTGRSDCDIPNYFPIMNRTCTGLTAYDVEDYCEDNGKEYDIYNDLKNNAFALIIKKDGSIGYRYGILDCDSEEEHYSVVEEFSKPGMIKYDEWNKVLVRVLIMNPAENPLCDAKVRKMKIMVYVNGFLKLISKELPSFDFRELDDIYTKQEGVPYNISIGGGTQGLMETILPDYYNQPSYILPLERDFGGTFLGDIKDFKIYEGFLDYYNIKKLTKKS